MDTIVVHIGSDLQNSDHQQDLQILLVLENCHLRQLPDVSPTLPFAVLHLLKRLLKQYLHFAQSLFRHAVVHRDDPHGLHRGFDVSLLFDEIVGAFHQEKEGVEEESDIRDEENDDDVVVPVVVPEEESGDYDFGYGPYLILEYQIAFSVVMEYCLNLSSVNSDKIT